MPKINTKCPKCQRLLWATPDQAGKRVRCPECKTIMRLPELSAALADELVAAELSGKTAAVDGPAAKPIKFHCSFCDEEIEFPAELAGQRAPCPECSRIVKVPVPVREGPKDWRKVERGAAAGVLLTGDKPPEGEWGTVTASARVTQQSLEEAQAIPVETPRVPVGRRIVRGVGGVAIAILIFIAVLVAKHFFSKSNQQSALAKALAYVPERGNTSLTDSLDAAEINRGAGEYYLKAHDLQKARSYLSRAAAQAKPAPDGAARDFMLIDIALLQTELGDPNLSDKVYAELKGTVKEVKAAQAKAFALEEVCRKLIEKNRVDFATTMAATVEVPLPTDRPEMKAIVGLELWAAGKKQPAWNVAKQLAKDFQDQKKRPPLVPTVLALLIATEQTGLAEDIAKTTQSSALKEPYPEVRTGFAAGLAFQGKWDMAQQIALSPGRRDQRLEALLAMAEVASTIKNDEQGKALVEKMCNPGNGLIEGPGTVSDWVLWRLVHVGVRTEMPGDQLKPVAERIGDSQLKQRALVEILRRRLQSVEGPDADQELSQLASQAHAGKMVELLCRHDARHDRSASLLAAIDRWDLSALRPFGYIGVALGEQDSGR